MPSIIRPGIHEYEIRSEIQRILVNQWRTTHHDGVVACRNENSHLYTFFQNRRVENGDYVLVMVEANGPGGYYAKINRTWCLSKPSRELLYAWEFSRKTQHFAASLLKPGVSPQEVVSKVNKHLVNHGYPAEARLFGHGQGYGLVERPLLLKRKQCC